MSASWTDPRHRGAGIWQHTPRHRPMVTDLLVAAVACVLGAVLFIGLLVAGRAGLCHVYDNALSYCPGFVPASTTTTENP